MSRWSRTGTSSSASRSTTRRASASRASAATWCACARRPRATPIRSGARWPVPEDIVAILPELWVAIGQTALMLAIGLGSALVFGGPLGIWLFLLGPGQTLANRPLFGVVGWFVNS